MIKEFRDFINKGNVLDLAVAVILGAAFGKIVGSLVEDILMPVIGAIFNVNIAAWGFTLKEAVMGADGKVAEPAVVFGIGKFLQSIIDFLFVAFPVFIIVKATNKSKETAPPAGPTPSETLLGEIRDLLKK
ncbi:MAG: large conductance mechanosensitive channel protein MscL [Saprospiraceae bacterium]